MNASLLAIGNMFAGTADPGPASSKLTKTKNAKHFSPLPAGNSPPTNASETTKTDNTPIGTQTEPADKPPQEFGHTLQQKITAEVSREAEAGSKSGKQDPSPSAAAQPKVVQLWLAQYSQDTEHGKEGNATKVQPKAGYTLAQWIAELRDDKFPSATGKAAKPTENKPFLTIDQSQAGPKAVLPNTPEGLFITDTQSDEGEGKSADGIQISNKTSLVTKGLTNQQSDKASMSEALVDADSETATASGKPAIALASDASGGQKAAPLTGKEFIPEALVDADSKTATASGKPAIALASDACEAVVDADNKTADTDEKPALADKPAGSGGQKTPALNTSFPQAEGKYSDPHQRVNLGLEKPATVAEEPTDNKAVHSQTLSELSAPNDKMSRPAGNSLSGDSPLKHLNVTELHASTGQTKGNSSSTSNSNANPDFEQALPANSAQNLVTESFSNASTQAAKTTDNTSPSSPSASISEQILESIHSSLRQGEQQVTIRLNPPELGRVFMKFQEQQDQITGLLEVSKTQTRYEIEHALPQIIRTLEDAGIQVKKFEVVLTDQPQQQPFRDQSLQDGSFQQQGFAERGNPDNKSANEWPQNDNSYQDIPEPQMLVTDDTINVLM